MIHFPLHLNRKDVALALRYAGGAPGLNGQSRFGIQASFSETVKVQWLRLIASHDPPRIQDTAKGRVVCLLDPAPPQQNLVHLSPAALVDAGHARDIAHAVPCAGLHLRSSRGRTSDTRRLSRGKRSDIDSKDVVTWIPTRAWSGVNLVDHRKWGVSIFPLDATKTGHWHEIEVLAEPFKALGADRGRQTITQRRQAPTAAQQNNERIQRKLANHDRKMGRPAKKRRGRPKGSTNVQH